MGFANEMKTNRSIRCAVAGTLALLAAVAAGPALAQGGPGGAPVRVAVAERKAISPTVWVAGTVVGRDDARLAAEVGGRLIWVAEVGDPLAAGDGVARLDDTELRIQVSEAQAVAARDKARLAFLEQELKRFTGLAAQSLITRSRLGQARSARDAAYSQWEVARARLARVQDRLERTTIKAPFAGVVTDRFRRTGERVVVGEDVLRLVTPGSLEVQLRVTLQSLSHLRRGAEAKIRASPAQTTGRVRALVPVGDDRSRLYDVRVEFSGIDWPAGTTVRVAVPTGSSREVIVVPRDALVLRREGSSVYRVKKVTQKDEEGKDKTVDTAERVVVTPGIASGEWIEVIGGIQAGDLVITRGGERMRPGQRVMIQPNPATGP